MDSIPDPSPQTLSTLKRRAEIGALEVLSCNPSITLLQLKTAISCNVIIACFAANCQLLSKFAFHLEFALSAWSDSGSSLQTGLQRLIFKFVSLFKTTSGVVYFDRPVLVLDKLRV